MAKDVSRDKLHGVERNGAVANGALWKNLSFTQLQICDKSFALCCHVQS